MHRWSSILVLVLANVGLAAEAPPASAERGKKAVHGQPALSPPLTTRQGYENVWKQWGLAEKPRDFAAAVRARYGLHPAPYDNDGLPMGLHVAHGLTGAGVTNDCLLCHAGRVAGQTVIGLGNSTMDVQALFEELMASGGSRPNWGFRFSYVRGTIDPVSPSAFLLSFRDPDINLRPRVQIDYPENVCSDPPAWWLLKRKKTRDWTGAFDARAARLDMAVLLHPFHTGEYVKKQEQTFRDIHAFVLSVEAPKYPFPIDGALAEKGEEVFRQECARCHGSYGPGGKYPNKIVPLEKIGTDPTLAEALTGNNFKLVKDSWLVKETGPDGQPFQVTLHRAYQAPPLDGIWATAPYFHNGSAPTVYHVLNSRARPRVFTRSYGTEKEDYDPVKLGLKITPVDGPVPGDLPAVERRKIYDTTQPGRGNGGHTFGDDLTEKERRAVIEYLKTL
jgi:mono/diheme cytochrome c family protein